MIKAVIGGIAKFHGRPVTVIVQEKGTNTKRKHYFGMPMPEGYPQSAASDETGEISPSGYLFCRYAGAFCGIEAEERGQGEAIARNLWELAGLKTPVLSVCDRKAEVAVRLHLQQEIRWVWMLENSVYSILSGRFCEHSLEKTARRQKRRQRLW